VWDNYPVNDWDLNSPTASLLSALPGLDNAVAARRLPLSPLAGRDPELPSVAHIYAANAAVDPVSGMPAMATALDYAWSGPAYRWEDSWASALRATAIPEQALVTLADASGPVLGGPTELASKFARACARVLAAEIIERRDAALDALDLVIDEHVDALRAVRATGSAFAVEVQPWTQELARQCTLARLAILSIRTDIAERAPISRALQDALAQPSTRTMVSGAGRLLAEYARGLAAGGMPDIPA
jgi:hypothetical protein